LRRCINKGLVKVRKTPARRYAYFVTPRGLAEKTRLTAEYLSYSFSLFRQARNRMCRVVQSSVGAGYRHIVLAGCSDYAEIAILCATQCDIKISAIVDEESKRQNFVGGQWCCAIKICQTRSMLSS